MSLSWWHGLVNRGTLKLKSSPARRHGRRRKEARRILFEPLEPRVLLDGNPGTDPGNGLINLNAGLSSPASPEAYITNPDRPGGGGVATTTTVTSSNASAVYGTAVTFTATVSAQSGGTAPTAGSVDFYDTTTSTDLGDGAFGSSTGTTSTWTLTTGVKTFNVTAGDTVTATYTAGSGFRGSSGTMTQTVNPFPITVTAVASTKTYDGSTSSSATPTISYGGPADSLVSGDTASFTEAYNTSNLGTGLTLAPAGSVNDGNGGHNYAVTLVNSTAGAIFPVGTTTTTTASTSQGSVVYGTVVTFTATVSAQSGSTAPGQGSVDFYDTTTSHDLGSGTFGISTGTTSTWTFTTGAKTFNVTTGDTITATYSPGLGFNGSSGTITQAVTPRRSRSRPLPPGRPTTVPRRPGPRRRSPAAAWSLATRRTSARASRRGTRASVTLTPSRLHQRRQRREQLRGHLGRRLGRNPTGDPVGRGGGPTLRPTTAPRRPPPHRRSLARSSAATRPPSPRPSPPRTRARARRSIPPAPSTTATAATTTPSAFWPPAAARSTRQG